MIKKALLISFLTAVSPLAPAQNITTSQKNFAVELNSTRVIFQGTMKSKSLSVLNPQSYPILIQSVSLKEDKKTTGSYIITPPLLRLEGKQRSNLLIRLIKPEFPADKESMEWICVKGIPPKDSLDENKGTQDPEVVIQLSLNTCNKVFYRPAGITDLPQDHYGTLEWAVKDGYYIVKNKGPFYINFMTVKHNGNVLNGFDYIAPFGEKKVKARVPGNGEIQWDVVTDIGGISALYKTRL